MGLFNYIVYLWHKYVLQDVWEITMNYEAEINEILTFSWKSEARVVWKEKEGKYWKCWLTPIT